jgi:hypothetical protein
VLKRAAPFLLMFALCFLLQTPIAVPVYELIPGGAFIQFPWRLLAIMTPALIVAAVYLADAALAGTARPFSLGAATAWMLVLCLAFAPMRIKRVPIEPPPMARVDFSWFREYEPKAAYSLRTLTVIISSRWAEAGCSYTVDSGADEVPEVRLGVECARSAMLPLPLFASPLHTVHVSSYARTHRCMSLPGFEGICSAVVPAGYSTVSVKLPSMASLPRYAWERVVAMSR